MCNVLFLDIKSNEECGLYTAKISDKIEITKNSDWIILKDDGICTGSGSILDPYIVQNLIINGDGTGNCISIKNSNVVFIIKNCTIFNSGSQTTNAGIYFENVQNGKITNSNCTANENGIYLLSSSSIEIKNNYASNNDRIGIRLEHSNNNLISDNTVRDNPHGGIHVVDSSCTISGNRVNNNDDSEIFVFYSHHSIISENIADEITIYNSDYTTISENEVNDNYGIFLLCSNYSEISDNILVHNNFEGIRISDSKNNEISGNILNGNSRGITLYNSKKNAITENTFINNFWGIYVENSKENQLTSNVFNYNDIGIYLDSNSICNKVSDNEFTENGVDVQDNQALCFSEIPILQIVVITIVSISLIIGGIIAIRKRSLKRKITLDEEPSELTSVYKMEPGEVIEKPVISAKPKLEKEIERIIPEEPPVLQEMTSQEIDLPTKYEIAEEDLEISNGADLPEITKVLEKEVIETNLKDETMMKEEIKEEIISSQAVDESKTETIEEALPIQDEIKEEIKFSEETPEPTLEIKKEKLLIKEDVIQKASIPLISEIICEYCGFSNEVNASFCRQCGQLIKKRE